MSFNILDFLPSHFRTNQGTLLKAILDAVTDSQGKLLAAVEAAIDQQFLATATGKYILYLGEQSGFVLPPNSGLDIRALRTLVPIAVANPKQVTDTLNKLIQAFYGSDKVRATAVATMAEPYSFADGDTILIETESASVGLVILASLFSDITSVTSAELSTFINSSQTSVLADSYADRKTNLNYLRIASTTVGVGSSIRMAGGTAQNVLKVANIIATNNMAGTTWSVSKVATYSDVTTFQWSGTGSNPQLYLVQAGDVATIRGLVDGTTNLSTLNGSYVVQDSGYDYFTVFNVPYQGLSDSFTQATSNNIVFTSQFKLGIYDGSEYAFTVETTQDKVAVTVPAVPPLARRFLSGSAHLHGADLAVLDFTRNSIQIDLGAIDTPPRDMNTIILTNQYTRPDFSQQGLYKLVGSDNGLPRNYIADTSDPAYGALPFTTIQTVGVNAISAPVGSSTYTLTFPYPHGLKYRWGFSLSCTSGTSNLTAGQLTQDFVVGAVVDPYTITFEVNDSSGAAVRYQGSTITGFDVYQQPSPQVDGSDFYLQFSSPSALTASGIQVGQGVRINAGTNLNAYFGQYIRTSTWQVLSISGAIATIRTSFGPGIAGEVISGASAALSGGFGGTVQYYFNKTSVWNTTHVLAGLQALFIEYTPSSNPGYVGSYLFDPEGAESQSTVTSQIVTNRQPILRGANPTAVFVDTVVGFPTSGSFIMDYGTDQAEGPIKFLSTIQNSSGNSQVLIDPAYRFQQSHASGALLWFVGANSPFTPDILGANFPVYLTGTAKARETLLQIMQLLVASGISIDFNALIPNLIYADPSVQPFE